MKPHPVPFDSPIRTLIRSGFRKCRLFGLPALVAAGVIGCMPPPSMPRYAIPPIGAQCTVQFQRDALGAGASLPISPRTNNINGADTSVSGALKQFTAEWIVLDSGGREIWIPKTVVLLIEVESASATP
ncbi:MAG: hypothetical protein H7A45_08305 [Verrucomicrobiales bacterium]|nr:hypothetical protein [Verrucomicrobiales bacterium]